MTTPDDVLAALCEKAGWEKQPDYIAAVCPYRDADGRTRSPEDNTDDALALARALGWSIDGLPVMRSGKHVARLRKINPELYKSGTGDTDAAAIVAALGCAEGVT